MTTGTMKCENFMLDGLNRGGFGVMLMRMVRSPVPFPTRGACCFRLVSHLGDYRDWSAWEM